MKTIVAKSVGWLLLFTLIISAFPAERVFAYYYEENEGKIGKFVEGMAMMEREGKIGYINKEGELVADYKYTDGFDFHEGMAKVSFHGKYGYINKKGKEVIPLQFDDASRFSEGLAWVRIRNKYFYINKKGKNITGKDEFSLGEEFREGRARVGRFDGSSKVYGIINKKGKVVIPLGEYEALNPHYSEGIIMAYKNNIYYFLDKDGEILFKIREESTDTYEDPYDPLKDDSDDYSDDDSDDDSYDYSDDDSDDDSYDYSDDDSDDDSYDYSDDTSWE